MSPHFMLTAGIFFAAVGGALYVYRSSENNAQRVFLKTFFTISGPIVLTLLGVIYYSAHGILPSVIWLPALMLTIMGAWPTTSFLSRRLTELSIDGAAAENDMGDLTNAGEA